MVTEWRSRRKAGSIAGVSVQAQLSLAVQSSSALATSGDFQSAQETLGPVLEVAVGALGADHPDVLSATRVLASIHLRRDEPLNARRLLEEALRSGQNSLNDSHPVILGISYDLAQLADALGNRHEARRNYTRLATYGPPVLGPGHTYVIAATTYLGAALPVVSPPAPPVPQTPPPLPPRVVRPPSAPIAPVSYADRVYRPFDHEHLSPISASPISITPVSAGSLFVESDQRPRPKTTLFLGTITILALLIAAGALMFAFRANNTSQGGTTSEPDSVSSPSPTPSSSVSPPTNLALVDNGSSVTVTWTDPAGGTAQFIVAAGQGTDLSTQHTTWDTTFTLNGLNPKLDYCFTVAAVYDTDRVAVSDLACTKRTSSSTSASASSSRSPISSSSAKSQKS